MPTSTTRRDILRGSALLAAASCLPRTASAAKSAAAQGVIPAFQLGIASYTFRKFDRAHLFDFAHQLKVPYINAKDVHIPMKPIDAVPGIAAEFTAAGLTLTALGTIGFPKDDDDFVRQRFDYAKAAGVPLIVAAPTHQSVARVAKFAKEYNIRVAIHNHGPEDKNFPSPFDVMAAIEPLGSAGSMMGCCIDVGHTTRAGVVPADAIRKIGPRVFDLHFKDLTDANDKASQVAVGDGILDFPGIFKALAAIHYKGFVDLEYEIFPDDPMPGVTKSFAYMRGVLAGLGYTQSEK